MHTKNSHHSNTALSPLPSSGYPNIFAHRGARGYAPENTMAAIRKARECNADGIEIDIQMTKDHEPVLFHDNTLLRRTNITQFPTLLVAGDETGVHHLTLEQLRNLSASTIEDTPETYPQDPDFAPPEETKETIGWPIPTLAEVLSYAQHTSLIVNLELKAPAQNDLPPLPIVEAVLKRIETFGMQHRVIISSFHHEYLATLAKRAPSIATGVLTYHALPSPVEYCQNLHASSYHPYWKHVTRQDIKTLHQADISVNVWTVNTAADIQAALELGADGLFSDFPDLAKQLSAPIPEEADCM